MMVQTDEMSQSESHRLPYFERLDYNSCLLLSIISLPICRDLLHCEILKVYDILKTIAVVY